MIIEIIGKRPRIDPKAFVVDSAIVIGDVLVGPEANIWFQSVIRGDVNYIHIGAHCNIQDGCVLHGPSILEDYVVLGHRVVAHGCRIKRGSLIGIGSIVLDGAEIGEESIVGAGSLVTPGSVIPPRSLALGIPATVVRSLREEEIRMIQEMAHQYLELKEVYRQALP
ncbi:MAG: putative acetyltransferase EpsM [Syntrophorhabdus sp. PtaU1.Bin153]|nr:MAG: putative acetyltransferase EpsM [Syntrophorhabdus sp. PtaU1.Bin153]